MSAAEAHLVLALQREEQLLGEALYRAVERKDIATAQRLLTTHVDPARIVNWKACVSLTESCCVYVLVVCLCAFARALAQQTPDARLYVDRMDIRHCTSQLSWGLRRW